MQLVFMARYCRNSDILSAPVRSNASFVWRSLVWSRDLVSRGLAWRIGDGGAVSVYNDSWVVGIQGNLRSFGEEVGSEGLMVRDIIDGDRRWDEGEVRRRFSPIVQMCIFNTPIAETGSRDERRWRFDEKGRFSVKSAYLADIGFYEMHASVSRVDRKSWSKLVWNVPIPPKARVFLWRAFNDVIPSAANLKAHHVSVSGICSLCGDKWASTEHSLVFCPRVVSIWKSSRFWTVLKRSTGLPLFDIASAVFGEWGDDDYALWGILTWQVWSFVCRLMHSSEGEVDVVTEASVVALLEAFCSAKLAFTRESSLGVVLGERRWRKPGHETLRVDVDAHFDPEGRRFGVGVGG